MSFKDWDLKYRKEQAERTKDLWRQGHYDALRIPLINKECINPKCGKNFKVKPRDPKKFCSRSCSASVNNIGVSRNRKILKYCAYCGELLKLSARKYCATTCQQEHQYNEYLRKWKKGEIDGSTGVNVKGLSKKVRRYLLEKYNHKCSICFWDKIHPLTGHVPLEVDHIDGNSENNSEGNLRILCPNCHSLTSSFRNLNKGNGRAWRLTYIAQNKLLNS